MILGGLSISRRYRLGGGEVFCKMCGSLADTICYSVGVDKLERTCYRCGYAWLEPTLEAKRQEKARKTKQKSTWWYLLRSLGFK